MELEEFSPENAAACDETEAARFYLKRLDACCEEPAASKEELFDVLSRVSTLATKAKTALNAYLVRISGKEMTDFDDGYPAEIDARLDTVFDNACFFGNRDEISRQTLQERVRAAQIAASAVPMLIARMESEASMNAVAAEKKK